MKGCPNKKGGQKTENCQFRLRLWWPHIHGNQLGNSRLEHVYARNRSRFAVLGTGKERFCLVLQTKRKRIQIKPKYIKDKKENEIVATRGGGGMAA